MCWNTAFGKTFREGLIFFSSCWMDMSVDIIFITYNLAICTAIDVTFLVLILSHNVVIIRIHFIGQVSMCTKNVTPVWSGSQYTNTQYK